MNNDADDGLTPYIIRLQVTKAIIILDYNAMFEVEFYLHYR